MDGRDLEDLMRVLRNLAIAEANKGEYQGLPGPTEEQRAFVRDWVEILHHAYRGKPETRAELLAAAVPVFQGYA